MKDSNKMIAALLVGAAAGAAVAWFLTSDKKDEMLSDLKDTAEKVKKDVSDIIDKGRKVVEDFTHNDSSDLKA